MVWCDHSEPGQNKISKTSRGLLSAILEVGAAVASAAAVAPAALVAAGKTLEGAHVPKEVVGLILAKWAPARMHLKSKTLKFIGKMTPKSGVVLPIFLKLVLENYSFGL